MFENYQVGIDNLDLHDGKSLEYYLELTKDYKSDFPDFVIKKVGKFNVIDESVLETGTKSRFGDFLFQNIKEQEIVYCAPRVGFGSMSAVYLAKKYGKKATLFMPAAKQASDHQLVCIEMGAKPIFRKIPAMPTLNSWAKKYAQENGAFFIPFGLKHPLVTAGAVRVIYDFFKDKEQPKEMWCVISTGVLSRALQIALPKTEFFSVAVARNIQQGELGRSQFISYHKPFLDKSDVIPTEFNSAENYDAKAWQYMFDAANEGAYFYNVAGNIKPNKLRPQDVDSQREWGEIRF